MIGRVKKICLISGFVFLMLVFAVVLLINLSSNNNIFGISVFQKKVNIENLSQNFILFPFKNESMPDFGIFDSEVNNTKNFILEGDVVQYSFDNFNYNGNKYVYSLQIQDDRLKEYFLYFTEKQIESILTYSLDENSVSLYKMTDITKGKKVKIEYQYFANNVSNGKLTVLILN